MKKISIIILLTLSVPSFAQKPLHVMTFNIRLNTAGDSLNAWPYRIKMATSQVLFYDAHLLGVQEALHDQMMDLQQHLPQYKYFGGGRDDGKTRGEYSAIFYDTTRLQWMAGDMFWLSQTPTVPGSVGWDAAITRIVTWCKFKERQNGKIFFAFNTHFDHMGQRARAESAKLLLQKVKDIAGKTTAIITGDFNATPMSEPIQIIKDKANPLSLTDTKAVSATPHYGPEGTFTGFQPKETGNEPIDYIFIKNGGRVLKHGTLSESWQGRFSSDHFPVLAWLIL